MHDKECPLLGVQFALLCFFNCIPRSQYTTYKDLFPINHACSGSISINMANEVLTSFLGALQASLSVLLVISYGVIAAQFGFVKGDSTKQISTLCVRMFLPALLITKVGSQLHADTGIRYVPILSKFPVSKTKA